MRLHTLTLTAFGPFARTQQADFDALSVSGLFLLHGPTGAGKTSVLDAICYALYGSVPGARRDSTTALRSDHADPHIPTEVRLDLTLAGRRLEVTRRPEQDRPKKRGTGTTRDKAVSLLRERDAVTGTWHGLSSSHQEIGTELAGLLGMNCDQFCQVALLPQGEFARFLRARAEDRATLLGQLFDTHRFGVAERRLAELRADAQQRVRSADEQLLSTAHRLGQAAGELPGPAARPPDGLAPGDPGLAGAVLEHAALARSAARERRDAADLALHAAETAHDAAQRRLAGTEERARLQQRHADARRRAAALDARGEELAALRTRLERARAADAVAPALDLRDAAEAEHQAAADGEARARTALPPGLTDAPSDRLAAREHRTRAHLGALEAARAAEERAARLGDDLARLERETAADEELLAEAERQLADWQSTRTVLQERVERAGTARVRAEQAAARLETALRRRDAALRRDRLARRLTEAGQHLAAAREAAAAAREHWLGLRERRLEGIAAELAAGLRPGAPCAVCGSTGHPRPARAAGDHVDRAAEDDALEASRAAEARRERAERDLASTRDAHAAAAADAGEDPADSLSADAEAQEAEHAAALAAAADAEPARDELEAAEQRHAAQLEQRQQTRARLAAGSSRHAVLQAERAALQQDIDRARDGAPGVAHRAAALEREAAALAAATEAARAAEETASRRKRADDRLADAAYRAGFPTPQAAAGARLDDARQRDLQRRLEDWQAERAAVGPVLAEEQTAAAAALPPADPGAARAAAAAATRRLQAASSARTAAHTRCADLDTLSARAADQVRQLAPQRAQSRRLTRLAGLVTGTAPENAYRMRLETYVLAARLEQVAAAAGVRLHRMSSGRYTLVHSDARAGGRGRSGLGLRVLDAWTGRPRDTATLSGGESFVVSLSLALGLADVVTGESGGRRLDTLFIDEGFGSLDEQALDEVLDVLDALRAQDRSVGIVSHVPDLRGRIPAQLEIVKTRRGSTLRHRGAPSGP